MRSHSQNALVPAGWGFARLLFGWRSVRAARGRSRRSQAGRTIGRQCGAQPMNQICDAQSWDGRTTGDPIRDTQRLERPLPPHSLDGQGGPKTPSSPRTRLPQKSVIPAKAGIHAFGMPAQAALNRRLTVQREARWMQGGWRMRASNELMDALRGVFALEAHKQTRLRGNDD